MTQLMQGKRGLIMGVANDHSIAWGIARTLAAHGATLALTYQGEALGRRMRPLAEPVDFEGGRPYDLGSRCPVGPGVCARSDRSRPLAFLLHAVPVCGRYERNRRRIR